MKFASSELTKLCLYIVLSFTIAALWTPFLYGWGKSLADYTAAHETWGALEWLGNKAGRAHFDRYFKRALVVTALVLLWPLIRSLRSSRSEPRVTLLPFSQLSTWRDMAAGWVMASGVFAVLAVVVVWKGYFLLQGEVSGGSFVECSACCAIISLIEEYLFRGSFKGPGYLWAWFMPSFGVLCCLCGSLYSASWGLVE